jgi:enoyl-CoA hydratase
MAMADESLLVEVRDQVLHLSINRPAQRNALSMSLLASLQETLNQYSSEPLKCVVITGTGDRCFASGGDLKELQTVRSNQASRTMSNQGRAALDAVRFFPVPVVAALNGHALGGGAELAMACDLRIATLQAELGFIQSTLNITTAWGGGIDLIDTIGNSKALSLLCAASRLSAVEAHRLGLVEAMCPAEETFEHFVHDFLSRYTACTLEVLRGYKSVTAKRRRQLHETLGPLAHEQFVTTWTHQTHWDAVQRLPGKKS